MVSATLKTGALSSETFVAGYLDDVRYELIDGELISMGVLALINSLGMLALISSLGALATIFSCFIQFQIVNLVCHEILSKTLLETVTYPVT